MHMNREPPLAHQVLQFPRRSGGSRLLSAVSMCRRMSTRDREKRPAQLEEGERLTLLLLVRTLANNMQKVQKHSLP
jgi:hypothetical protein